MNQNNNRTNTYLSPQDLLKSTYQPSIAEQNYILSNGHKAFTNKKTDQNDIRLYDALKYSYQPLSKQEEFYKRQGYQLDKDLSNDNQQVLFNKDKNKLLYNIAGTHKLSDWGTDAYLLFGNLKNTNRYKEADERLKQAKQKYNVSNATITGHSLGAGIGNYIASKDDKAYLLDEGATFGQLERNNPNHKHYRVGGDVVSSLAKDNKNMGLISRKKGLGMDPISSHKLEQIQDESIFV